MAQQKLSVYANPFCADLDHEGRAHGHVHYAEADHPSAQGQAPRFVGCRLIASANPPGASNDPNPAKHQIVVNGDRDLTDWDHVWEYDTEPTTLIATSPATLDYYLRHLRATGHHGPALLPADVETYKLVHGTDAGFRHPHARLHQYVTERKAFPRVKPAAGVDGSKRDHEAEWHAFVGAAVKAEADAKAEAERKAQADAIAEAHAAALSQPTTAPLSA